MGCTNKIIKLIFIVLINLIIFFLFVVILEYVSFFMMKKTFNVTECNFYLFKFHPWSETIEEDMELHFSGEKGDPYKFFKDFYKKSQNKILLLGCSVAYGLGLSDNQSFSYKLSNMLNSTVYNRAYIGGGFAQALWLLNSSKLKESMNGNSPNYIIYIYIPDHIIRMLIRVWHPADKTRLNYFYKFNTNQIKSKPKNDYEIVPPSFLQSSYFYTIMQNAYMGLYIIPALRNDFLYGNVKKEMKLYLKYMNMCITKNYPNAKFIIISLNNGYYFEKEIFSDYNNINIQDITGIDLSENKNQEKYTIDGIHPNELYWDTVMPVIIEELKKF